MKKRKDNPEKLNKKRFTLIDLLICIIVISAVAYICIRFLNINESTKDSVVEYKAVFVLPTENSDSFKVGDIVLTADGEKTIGEIVNVEISPYTEKTFDITVSGDGDTSVDNISKSDDDSLQNQSSEDVEASLGEEAVALDTVLEMIELSDSSEDSDYSILFEESGDSDAFNTESSEPLVKDENSADDENTIVDEVIIDGYVKVIITVSANLDMESHMYLLNGSPLKIDSEIELTTKKYAAYGKCLSIEEKAVSE